MKPEKRTTPSEIRHVVITGVSSGIGHDLLRYLIDAGYFVFGSVRSVKDQRRLEQEFPENFRCLLFDTTDTKALCAAADQVSQALNGKLLAALICNAGYAIAGPLELLDDDAFDQQLLTNVSGTRNAINAFLPLLGSSTDRLKRNGRNGRSPGKIILNSSISGVVNTPINGSYCISKHAIESLGEVYRRELMGWGIDVISIRSGPLRSKIWEKNAGSLAEFRDSAYASMIRRTEEIMLAAQKAAKPAEVFSQLIQNIIENPRPKSSYIIQGSPWKILLMQCLPPRWLDRLMYGELTKESARSGS